MQLISYVLPEGEKVVAVSIDYGTKIDGIKLSPSAFKVVAVMGENREPRTITKVYTNDVPETTASGKNGTYVIIELDTNNSNASTFYFDQETYLTVRYDFEYYVSQMEDITAANGSILSASLDKTKVNNVKTPVVDDFLKQVFKNVDGECLNYCIYKPNIEPDKKYPLVLFTHGAGERGSDNTLQLIANQGAVVWAAAEHQANNPCFVLAPQCPADTWWSSEKMTLLLEDFLKDTIRNYPVDTNRIYIQGISMGGMETWNLITRNPELFAAAIPICGAWDIEKVKLVKGMPIWAFHAEDDPVVPVAGIFDEHGSPIYGTRDLIAALSEAGSCNVKYTEYKKGYVVPSAHSSWIPAYNNEEVIDWLFAQNKAKQYKTTFVKQGVYHIEDFRGGADSIYLIEGSDKALLIDTGMGSGNLAGLVKSLTNLPVEVAITHGHWDHMGQADQFNTVYMSYSDKEVLKSRLSIVQTSSSINIDSFIDIKEGDKIDLGGGKVVEVIDVPGHTPGSVAFLDEYDNMIFTGDAIGSSYVWMQIQDCLPLDKYLLSLEHLEEIVYKFDGLSFMDGHKWQEGGVPLTKQYVTDMRILTEKILNGDIVGKPYLYFNGREAVTAAYGSAEMKYSLSNIRSADNIDETKYQAYEILPNIINIKDFAGSNMYLVKGHRKALLIDAGMGTGDLKAYVEKLAGELPLEIIITHGHIDHISQAGQFHKAYMSFKDKNVLNTMFPDINPGELVDIEEGHIFDLGGRILKVLALPGHTPGSIVLLDEENKILFTGDAIGGPTANGGIWMQLPGCSYVDEYLATLKVFREKYYDKFDKILAGHNIQVVKPKYFDNVVYSAQSIVDKGVSILVPSNAMSLNPRGKSAMMAVIDGDSEMNAASLVVDSDHVLSHR